MLGSLAFFEEGDDVNSELEWVFQVHKERSFKEVILFKEKMNEKDECLKFFQKFFVDVDDIKVLSNELIA